jgi:hypothetical protein
MALAQVSSPLHGFTERRDQFSRDRGGFFRSALAIAVRLA